MCDKVVKLDVVYIFKFAVCPASCHVAPTVCREHDVGRKEFVSIEFESYGECGYNWASFISGWSMIRNWEWDCSCRKAAM